MSRSTTAVVLSALVLPGAGQIYLKHYQRGIALIGVSLVCLWFIVVRAMQQASAVLMQLESEGGALDAAQIAGLVSQFPNGAGSSALTVAVWVLAVCWVVGIADAYRLGNKPNVKTSG